MHLSYSLAVQQLTNYNRDFFAINYFISETTSYNIYRHNTFYYTQVLSSHAVK